MQAGFTIDVDGQPLPATRGQTVAAVLISAGLLAFSDKDRASPNGHRTASRGVFCGMGVCFDCLVTIDGVPDQRACITAAHPGMQVTTRGAASARGRGPSPWVTPPMCAPNASVPEGDPTAPAPCRGGVPSGDGPTPAPLIVVIGAGPAGLAAAVTAAELGLNVALVDEAAEVGGQYLQPQPDSTSPRWQTAAERRGAELIARLETLQREASSRVQVITGATVWHLGPDLSVFLHAEGGSPGQLRWPKVTVTECLHGDAVILATGARETVVPFPGWTLPGVMTVGAAQLLAKRHGVLPGRRILLAGSGPLLLPAAAHLINLGAQVVAVVEAARPSASWRRLIGPLLGNGPLQGNGERIGEGRHYLATLLKARVPYLFGRAVAQAAGDGGGATEGRATFGRVTVDVARLGPEGTFVPGTAETWQVDALCIGWGFVPNIELAQLAGAKLTHAPELGGWACDRRPHDPSVPLQSTVPGLFVAGETAGVAGAAAAMLDGRLAAMSAAVQLGCLEPAGLQAELERTARQRQRMARFGAAMNELFAPPPALYAAMPDSTPVCRCEEVTAGEVRAAVAAGAHSLDALKRCLRVGQGECQGRTCGPIIGNMIASQTGERAEAIGLFTVRPPVKPLSLAALMAGHRASEAGRIHPDRDQ